MYSENDKKIMVQTSQARHKSRLQEIINFTQTADYHKIGIANCICMEDYAQILTTILESKGFEVVHINCRESGLEARQICDTMSGSCCDPLSQAEYLNREKTDFNIILGLCVGHEILFRKYAQAPSTVFIVKDFSTGHNPVNSLINDKD